jgi:hypothetical protein
MRITPPSVDRARARYDTGTASVSHAWRASPNTDCAMPTIRHPSANTASCPAQPHSAKASTHHAAAATMARRSPCRVVISDAGMFASSEPMPISATAKAAIAGVAPRSRAVSGTTGRIAPSPSPNSSEGPNAGTAMRRSEKGGGACGRSGPGAGGGALNPA